MSNREIIEIFGGLRFEVMISSQDSNSTCCALIESTPPNGGPPIHKHLREEEIFTVVEGEYEFYRQGEWLPMAHGVPILSPRDTYHAFRNVGAAVGKMLLFTNGGGLDDYFRSIANLKFPEEADRFDLISRSYGYIYKDV